MERKLFQTTHQDHTRNADIRDRTQIKHASQAAQEINGYGQEVHSGKIVSVGRMQQRYESHGGVVQEDQTYHQRDGRKT